MEQNEKIQKILSSKEVREILRISARTLQTYRDKRMLSFSQIGRKIYYNVVDIEEYLSSHHIKSKNYGKI